MGKKEAIEPQDENELPQVAATPELWEASKTSLQAIQDMMKCRLGELLVAAHKINPDQLNKALIYQKKNGGLLGQILRNARLIEEPDLALALQKQHLVTTVTMKKVRFTIEAVEALPPQVCRNMRALPFELVQNILCVAMANPLDGETVAKLKSMAHKYRVKIFDCPWPEIENAMTKCFVQRTEIPNISPTKLVRDTDLLLNNNWDINPVEALALKLTIPPDINAEMEIKPIHVDVRHTPIANMVDRQELQELVKGSLFDVIRKWEVLYTQPGPFQPKVPLV